MKKSKNQRKQPNPHELLAAKVRAEVFEAIPFGGGLVLDRVNALERHVRQLEDATTCLIISQKQ